MKTNQFGRSMIEMLGVLAIIGVLSVGAIAGYQKAMMKYKLNKHATSFSFLLGNALQYTHQLVGYQKDTDIERYASFFDRAKLIPDGMKYDSSDRIIDQFGNEIWIYRYVGSNYMGMGIQLDNNQFGSKVCANIINVAKENADNIYDIKMQNYSSDKVETYSDTIFGNKYCNNENTCLSKIKLSDIENTCYFCKEKTCTLYIRWY